MKNINNIQELFIFINDENDKLANHVCENDGNIPSFSKENLAYEANNLMDYVNQDDNTCPDYYGCGLLSRCLCIVQESNTHCLGPDFFTGLGYFGDDVTELKKMRWY
jgi:hypothetical protein